MGNSFFVCVVLFYFYIKLLLNDLSIISFQTNVRKQSTTQMVAIFPEIPSSILSIRDLTRRKRETGSTMLNNELLQIYIGQSVCFTLIYALLDTITCTFITSGLRVTNLSIRLMCPMSVCPSTFFVSGL